MVQKLCTVLSVAEDKRLLIQEERGYFTPSNKFVLTMPRPELLVGKKVYLHMVSGKSDVFEGITILPDIDGGKLSSDQDSPLDLALSDSKNHPLTTHGVHLCEKSDGKTTALSSEDDLFYAEPLKPCPFCGGKNLENCNTNDTAFWIECNSCGASLNSSQSIEDALWKWNWRIGETHEQ